MKKNIKVLVLIAIFLGNITVSISQVSVGMGGGAPSVTIIQDDSDGNYVIYKNGKKEPLPSGMLQVNFGFKIINTPTVIRTGEIQKLKFGEHVFVATPRKNGKTKFKEIVMFNDNYYMTTVRGPSSVTVTVYDRKTNKTVKGKAGKGFEISHKGTTLKGGKELTKGAIKAMIKTVEQLEINTYFPNCGDIESQMLKKAENGENVLMDFMYKNCNNSKDLYSSWY